MNEREQFLLSGYGVLAVNNSGHVVISDKVKGLFFIGKALYRDTLMVNFDTEITLQRFEINSRLCPMPFVQFVGNAFSVVSIREVSPQVWQIECIFGKSSAGNAPLAEIYCFADIGSATDNFAGVDKGHYGLQVKSPSGELMFDSRYSPLIVSGGAMCAPPAEPLIHWDDIYAEIDPKKMIYPYWSDMCRYQRIIAQHCNTDSRKNRHQVYTLAGDHSKPMFYYAAMAKTTWSYKQKYDSYRRTGPGDIIRVDFVQESNYWAQFRSAIKVVGLAVYCDWIAERVGCRWYKDERYSPFDIVSILDYESEGGETLTQKRPGENLFTAWASTISANERLNMGETALLVSDGSLYD